MSRGRLVLALNAGLSKLKFALFEIDTALKATTPAMGGVDGRVFTAGIGENLSDIRSEICARRAWSGLRLEAAAHAANADRIYARRSRVDVRVIATMWKRRSRVIPNRS